MEMEIVMGESIGIGEDLTAPLSPIAYALHDSFLSSHCASCFHPLPNQQQNLFSHYYCSPSCSSSHSPFHIASDAHLLPHSISSCTLDTSHLRVALLLLLLHVKPSSHYDRISGLLSNRVILTHHQDDLSSAIENGARAMAAARGHVSHLLEEAVLCAVITNAVDVQDRFGRSVGIAVYDTCFSWINHSCSPNASYRFVLPHPASSSSNLLTGGSMMGGPRIVVRSIKPINKGERVTIAYTDLLQPKDLRQSELWSKYRFTCSCPRCLALPLTYVDQRLLEMRGSSDVLSECIDDAVHDYLSSNNAESCCNKLEAALLNHEMWLHTQNHLCLNAYTTLASAYSTASADASGDENVLNMKRFSAAYSILLALLTHDLFLYDSSLIISVSHFWVGAAESLIKLARCLSSSNWHSSCGCGLIDIFEGNYDTSKKRILKCVMRVGGKVWSFLVGGNGYLEIVKDPVDLRWTTSPDSESESEYGGQCVDDVYELGVHCLLYGGVLSNISSGCHSHLSCYVRGLLSEL